MGKTLRITDDELGATASVRIDVVDGQPVIRSLHFDAEGDAGLSRAALGLMQDLGLTLPEEPVKPPAVRKRQPPTKHQPPAKKAAAKKQPPARKPPPSQPPSAAELGGAAEAPALPAAPPAEAANGHPATELHPALRAPQFQPPDADEPAAAPKQRKTYRTGPPPNHTQLRAAFRLHRGDLNAMAEQYGASVTTVGNWLRKARENGAAINLDGLDEPATTS